MPSRDQIERFVSECLLFRLALKAGEPLVARHKNIVKSKLYELIFDLECPVSDRSCRNQN